MNAIQQKCRPKHQVLVLKCYPRTTKGAVDVKPNSSELSYLLYYATSRRSKIQKIGAFLEKKTASDVWRMRIGNVQVTLGILTALVEKSPKDAVLIAPCILKILDLILRSSDITMIESSLPTWEAFCENHDPSSLFADQAYLNQYESVVRFYAKLASTANAPLKGSTLLPIQVRWRSAGLEAIKCIVTSDALATPSGRQIDAIMPFILENLWNGNADYLNMLVQRMELEEKVDSERLHSRRRNSVATTGTNEAGGDANNLAAAGTVENVDKLAEEDVGILAMQCLKSIFVVPNRAQIYNATTALIKFIAERVALAENIIKLDEKGRDAGWAISLYSIIARWAPVQDRYVILVSALDNLTHTSMKGDTLNQHWALTAMIESLLRSDINLIGLSVMDVLLGLIKQIRKLFQLTNMGASTQSLASDKTNGLKAGGSSVLLTRLEQCIGDLASHVYYADQISDMIATILGRLRPSQSGGASTPPGEKLDGQEATGPGASVLDLSESQMSSYADAYFASNAGRISALRIVKGILHVANPKARMKSTPNLGRNRVPASVWEGTQWLLRDSDGCIRQAYVEAIMTWLDLETTNADLAARDDAPDFLRSSAKSPREAANGRRVVSGTSTRERQAKSRYSHFLPQLHLAIYDNALQYVDFDSDLVMLHSLLTKLVFKLGVNAARYGVPMIYRLQEEVMEVEQPIHKVRVAALCHGYFWALTEKFEFETSAVGRAVNNEIIRRRSKNFWVEGIHIPAPPMDQIGQPGKVRPQPAWDLSSLEREELLPFDDRSSLVHCIAIGYEQNTFSPPGSPAGSPGRALSGPTLGASISAISAAERPSELSSSFREQMMSEWSREEVMAALAAEGKTESIHGSRAGTIATNLRGLTMSAAGLGANGHLPTSSLGSQVNLRPHSSQAFGERELHGPATRYRQASIRSGISPTHSASSRIGVPTVEQLKRILSGSAAPQTPGFSGTEDDSAESLVSYYSNSEKSFSPTADSDRPTTSGARVKRSMSGSPNAPFSPSSHRDARGHNYADDDDDPPPVPALPNLGAFSDRGSPGTVSIHDYAMKSPRRNIPSRGGDSIAGRSDGRDEGGKGLDLQELLRDIDSNPHEGSLGNLTKPPY
ncbi:Protein EFR3 [Escovopsis weberi]|uniref:Protein EFR3 n=1 Tax=Escovopsis weberi TaxID=150374 RepID=A0A0M8N700_ESCWE|nr:Protein EFR3 [Escovopsis weberi]